METCIQKRNGDKETFTSEKLENSIIKAFKSVKSPYNKSTLKSIMSAIDIKPDMSTYDLRDQIEFVLMERGYYNVAKAFIVYSQSKIAEDRDTADKIKFFDMYCNAINSASGSQYDANSNVECKNIATLAGELPKCNFIKVNRKMLYDKMKKMYNKKTADQYLKLLKEHFIYSHDETNISPYCCSITLYPWLLNGTRGIGGNSTAPTNLKSFCGGFINLVFIVSSMISGACLYKNQKLSIKEDGKYVDYSAKDFVSKFKLANSFDNYQGVWEYANVDDKNMFIRDGSGETKITKVYRRAYSDKIYRIKTSKGYTLECSKDHKIMTVFTNITGSFCNAIEYDIPAENLHIGNNVFIETDMSNCPDHDYNGEIYSVYFDSGYIDDTIDKYNTKTMYDYNFDTISEIETFSNDDECVYEIETESHYYNVGGIRTHNCATPEFLMYLNYFLGKEYGVDYYKDSDKIVDLSKKQRTLDKIITDCFEQVIYSINQPTGARNFQAVFWNISYYDQYYFNSIFSNFVFPDMSKPDWNGLNWLQKRFMTWFNKERTKTLLTFPVETMAMLSEKNEDGTYDIKDKEYADFTAKMYSEGHSFFTYLSDSADSLSSCCFTGDTDVIYKHDGQPKLDTFKTVYDTYESNTIDIYHDGMWCPGKCIKLPNRLMYRVKMKNNAYIDVSDNHINVTNNGDVKTTDLKVGDYMKFTAHIRNEESDQPDQNVMEKYNAYWVEITEISELPYTEDIYCFEMEDKSVPYFTLANGVITHNCRLRNEIQDNEFSYSLGAGGIVVGSKKVITLNINRCIQYAHKNNIPYLNYIEEVVDLIHKTQIAYNDNLKELHNKGMLPLYDAGFIALNRQYLTVGINGLLEGAEYLNIEISDNDDYATYVQNVLSVVETYNKKYRTRELMFNCEMVPAENLGVKHAKWDKEDGYIINRDCYNSYFFKVEDESTSTIDKIKLHGRKYIKHLTGGSACHINLTEHLSKVQYRKLLNVAAQEGCNYFTFNIPNTVCNKCGHINKQYLKECPKCHSTDIDYITRIIGYIKRISNFSLDRQVEAKKRYYDSDNKPCNKLISTTQPTIVECEYIQPAEKIV